jgi:hypothetical protein
MRYKKSAACAVAVAGINWRLLITAASISLQMNSVTTQYEVHLPDVPNVIDRNALSSEPLRATAFAEYLLKALMNRFSSNLRTKIHPVQLVQSRTTHSCSDMTTRVLCTALVPVQYTPNDIMHHQSSEKRRRDITPSCRISSGKQRRVAAGKYETISGGEEMRYGGHFWQRIQQFIIAR